MSSILRLRILGIRAFDNREPQDLEFSSPLTLICGPNGVGKTTVIECLRYVATGDLPPNAKGGAFVHDPRMSSEGEVRAQVKLLFKDAAGHRMVTARSMKLSVTNKGSYSFKTLEGYIKVQDKAGGGIGSVGSRCADLNVHVPLALGIPPAILNYVVFCHQEDSLWPLSEPSIVKRRFDDIFEATKYTKALESLKLIRKDYMSNIRVEKVEVDHLKVDQERAKEKQVFIEQIEYKIKELQEVCEDLQEQRRLKSQQLNNAVEHSQRVQQLSYETKDLCRRRDRISQNLDLVKDQLAEHFNDERLEAVGNELRDSDLRQKQLEDEISGLKAKRTNLQNKIDEAQQQLAVLANQQGRVEQLQDNHFDRLKQRSNLVGGDDFITWRERKQANIQDLNSKVEEMELGHRKEEEAISHRISSLEAERLQLRQSSKTLTNNIKDLDKQIKDLTIKASELNGAEHGLSSDEMLHMMHTRLEEIQKESAETRADESQLESVATLDGAIKKVRKLEIDAEQSREAVQIAIDASSAQSRLVFLRDSIRELESRIENNHAKLLKSLNEEGISVPEEDHHNADEYARKSLKQLTENQEQISLKLGSLKNEFSSVEKAIKKAESRIRDLQTMESDCLSQLGGDSILANNYDQHLHDAEEALITATEEQEQLQFAHKFFSKALKLAESSENPSCLLCEHHKTPDEAQALASKLSAKILALSVTPEEAEAETKARRSSLERLRELKPKAELFRRAVQDIALCEEDLKNQKERYVVVENEIKSAETTLETTHRRMSHLDLVVGSLLQQQSRSRDEMNEIQTKLELESGVAQIHSNELTPQEAQKRMEDTEQELKQARSELERVKLEQERFKSRVSHLNHREQELKLKISEHELKNSRLKQVEQQISISLESQKHAEEELEQVQQARPHIESQINDTQSEMKRIKYEHAQLERQLAEERSNCVMELQRFDGLNREIEDFESTHGPEPLLKLRKESNEVSEHISKLSTEMEDIGVRLSAVEKQSIDFGSYLRNYQDNVRYRKMQVELSQASQDYEKAAQQLKEVQEEIGGDYEQEIRLLQEAVGTFNHKISTKTGEAKALQEQMQQVRHELATSYHDTAEQYRRAVVKLQTSEGAVDDLIKYVKALDAAIMQYHSIKMAEINTLLDEMWKRTYTGTDIDTIMIRSESDAGSASTRASYNYRVCMVKQDTELDMRGRCSAGQKVLASILIRMALSECFGSSSGLIVLDEPTTNLDRENVEALAQSLSDIIASRRSQRNFQLIVITHDEHFLALMNPSSYCNYYYRIERDSRQLSKVRKMPIASLS